ncbi:3-phosphoshikimate 1-carboxyvinyltransferase [Glycomyces algeriensis]|uniref:3-phosphoshikimate 1-carboxyvinyltransferase n=1 Tax=Glycomyces algeriensis TaxID=256037 RepID=A0A9W6G8V2_9ACTN|nr:3-phosphoshikimate 1-carboxyvinyltransferase [Glycomyces algeriensis]MDA1365305.1 3-phosphoshikimate 1-carboxyvinyltransferase [Glycomyces algeriensis]MDR7349631.1 3-phosphoshikimate 1-carboxyvinyltransferase [Glycomyces algeriensis]GLI42338.1 3-phosphoshikimate 1-carboxyvinyltransferase 1 [Glycomyces algeriensis]
MNATAAPKTRRWETPFAEAELDAVVRVPGSKSMTARALILAALASGPSMIRRPLIARDTLLMVEGLRSIGVAVDTGDDEVWTVTPATLKGGTEVDCGLAGTVMRFLPPVAALADGPVAFDGDPHARKRPNDGVIKALRDLGVAIEDGGRLALPFTVNGTGTVKGGALDIDASKTSQLVSALLMAAPRFEQGLDLRHIGDRPVPSRPYLDMVVHMLRQAGAEVDDSEPNRWRVAPGELQGREWVIEPDLQNAAPFLLAAVAVGGRVTVEGWPTETTQAGDKIRDLLVQLGSRVEWSRGGLTVVGSPSVEPVDLDLADAAELTPTLAALFGVNKGPFTIRGVAHIRGHETDRVTALVTELRKIGADVDEFEDGFRVNSGGHTTGTWETYADHRMAHAGAVAGLVVPGLTLSDVNCVSKTWPDFAEVWEQSVLGHGNASTEEADA